MPNINYKGLEGNVEIGQNCHVIIQFVIMPFLNFICVEEIEEESETTVEADLTDKQKHQLKHRELFLSRQYESLPATHIR